MNENGKIIIQNRFIFRRQLLSKYLLMENDMLLESDDEQNPQPSHDQIAKVPAEVCINYLER